MSDRDSQIDFEWDPVKARENVKKHQVTFEEAATVFEDSMEQSMYDDDHSHDEERWISQGRARSGRLLVVSHTFAEVPNVEIRIRLISARLATRRERKQYETE